MSRFSGITIYFTYESPIGEFLLLADGEALRGLYMQEGPRPVEIQPAWRQEDAWFAEVRSQLDEYFGGERITFSLPLRQEGTEFELLVWQALREIPYGETRSYGEIAERIGQPGEARAVGTANGRNPISVIVPCHRVIGADGSLTGFVGGLERKRSLLELESGVSQLV